MDKLQVAVTRLHDGECPICKNRLNYFSGEIYSGKLEKNAMSSENNLIEEKHIVYCNNCGYSKQAYQIGLKLIPIDRIDENDINWDKKYLEDNTIVWGKKGKNPFDIKDKD